MSSICLDTDNLKAIKNKSIVVIFMLFRNTLIMVIKVTFFYIDANMKHAYFEIKGALFSFNMKHACVKHE